MKNVEYEDQIRDFIELTAGSKGFFLLDIFRKDNRIEIILDRTNGITLDECASFNRAVVKWMEENDKIPDNLIVDVCSPGLDRELKKTRDFQWASGKHVHIITREPVGGKREVYGILTLKEEGVDILTEENGLTLSIPFGNIVKARLFPSLFK
ncbi:MAG: hypothetical protein HQL30_01305 [Candidatus Omnitrophica bacterium]|nr:hypothetical protein [Candidatus Omnitrophota bacterium]